MSNIKKARYTNAPKLLNPKLSVIKVTGLHDYLQLLQPNHWQKDGLVLLIFLYFL
jgi:hypothetical protein